MNSASFRGIHEKLRAGQRGEAETLKDELVRVAKERANGGGGSRPLVGSGDRLQTEAQNSRKPSSSEPTRRKVRWAW